MNLTTEQIIFLTRFIRWMEHKDRRTNRETAIWASELKPLIRGNQELSLDQHEWLLKSLQENITHFEETTKDTYLQDKKNLRDLITALEPTIEDPDGY